MKSNLLSGLVIAILLSISVSVQAGISPRTYNALNAIQGSLGEEPNPEKLLELEQELTEIQNGLEGNSTGLALAFQIMAQIKDAQGDEEYALKYIKLAYGLEGLNEDAKSQLAISLGYLYYAQEQYDEVIKLFNDRLKEARKELSATGYAILASAHFAKEQFAEGLPSIEKACELTDKPKEQWLSNAFSASYRLKHFRKALKYVNELVLHFPHKKQYWEQKTAIHQQFEEYDQAAVLTELSRKQGYLDKETHYFNLGILLASVGAPYEVAVAIDRAIKDKIIEPTEKIQRLLSMAWVQAREYGQAKVVLNVLFEQFGDKKDGLQLLAFEIDDEEWKESIGLAEALLKLELRSKEKGRVLLMKGIAEYRDGNTQTALVSLGKASSIESIATQAKSWMNYIKQMEG